MGARGKGEMVGSRGIGEMYGTDWIEHSRSVKTEEELLALQERFLKGEETPAARVRSKHQRASQPFVIYESDGTNRSSDFLPSPSACLRSTPSTSSTSTTSSSSSSSSSSFSSSSLSASLSGGKTRASSSLDRVESAEVSGKVRSRSSSSSSSSSSVKTTSDVSLVEGLIGIPTAVEEEETKTTLPRRRGSDRERDVGNAARTEGARPAAIRSYTARPPTIGIAARTTSSAAAVGTTRTGSEAPPSPPGGTPIFAPAGQLPISHAARQVLEASLIPDALAKGRGGGEEGPKKEKGGSGRREAGRGRGAERSEEYQPLPLLGSIREKGFASSVKEKAKNSNDDGAVRTSPRVRLPEPTVLPFPVARHRAAGPHWVPVPKPSQENLYGVAQAAVSPLTEMEVIDAAEAVDVAIPIVPKRRSKDALKKLSKFGRDRREERREERGEMMKLSKSEESSPREPAPRSRPDNDEGRTVRSPRVQYAAETIGIPIKSEGNGTVYGEDGGRMRRGLLGEAEEGEEEEEDGKGRREEEEEDGKGRREEEEEEEEEEEGGRLEMGEGEGFLSAGNGGGKRGKSAAKAKPTAGKMSADVAAIDAENRALIGAMSAEQIAEMQAELAERFPPKLLDMLRKRGAEKAGKKSSLTSSPNLPDLKFGSGSGSGSGGIPRGAAEVSDDGGGGEQGKKGKRKGSSLDMDKDTDKEDGFMGEEEEEEEGRTEEIAIETQTTETGGNEIPICNQAIHLDGVEEKICGDIARGGGGGGGGGRQKVPIATVSTGSSRAAAGADDASAKYPNKTERKGEGEGEGESSTPSFSHSPNTAAAKRRGESSAASSADLHRTAASSPVGDIGIGMGASSSDALRGGAAAESSGKSAVATEVSGLRFSFDGEVVPTDVAREAEVILGLTELQKAARGKEKKGGKRTQEGVRGNEDVAPFAELDGEDDRGLDIQEMAARHVAERDLLRADGDPARAGYSLREATSLARSTVPAQRAAALRLIAAVLTKAANTYARAAEKPGPMDGSDARAAPVNSQPTDSSDGVDWSAIWAYAFSPPVQLAVTLRWVDTDLIS
ncbi:hypothetical protein CBR_g45640 [Chara braunii]|uniref:RNA polymerase II-associated protein 1 N-terminal domain-containing protein n=1 Tax=Chara braunii TaxID=69332 RepID=A0A388K3R5_CHABU|nr:hypothetical protein CBR_g45640 [Chara braunii]|eukprot:GBG64583.1 hypothetical protein CBR_g45640 [Chara braunii]